MRLSDTVEEQSLFYTPFRYEPYPYGSRFRRADQREGVFYGALEEQTAIAETAFYTLLFFLESPETVPPESDLQRTSFQVGCNTGRAIDLTDKSFSRNRKEFEALNTYEACQSLADDARKAEIDLILYRSVRDPERGLNGAILSPSAFTRKKPYEASQHTWRFYVSRESIRAAREFPKLTLTFERAFWAEDMRIK